jgi:hypothetical protein
LIRVDLAQEAIRLARTLHAAYRAAARAATNLQQQRYLDQQITRLQAPPGTVR